VNDAVGMILVWNMDEWLVIYVIMDWVLSQPGSRRDGEPKKKTGLKKKLGVATIVILENYGKP